MTSPAVQFKNSRDKRFAAPPSGTYPSSSTMANSETPLCCFLFPRPVASDPSVPHLTDDSYVAANQSVCGHEARRYLHLREPVQSHAVGGSGRRPQHAL